ncbi:beta-3-deoxy-D-manno-oct-2-ulosonic acid transferase [Sphingobium sp.]|uniref:capsular polysaccharide export protein, LipB/KpsS family n=1 Tax=Sphingobium sp. TaxID=1912891 RepID=UPI0025DDA5DB|nr:beta-3-deoxy-D-manno-oct-2-ulosonic acid transferase [Sphingobium sp.]
MTPALPFLRSPPFPGVSADIAAISVAGEESVPVSDALLDRIAWERVGGCFWGAPPKGIRVVVGSDVPVPVTGDWGEAMEHIGILPGAKALPRKGRSLPRDCDLWALVGGAQSVHAGPDEEVALIAGLLGVPVTGPDGAPIPATELRVEAARRIGAARYRDCFTGEPIGAEAAVDILSDWRRHMDDNRGLSAASGMAFWKRDAMTRLLWDGHRAPPFLSARRGLRRAGRERGTLAIWPSRVPATLRADAARAGIPVARVEDGFLRSKGLGAALHPPGSVVVDRSGIYYDAQGPSDLETLLATRDFTPDVRARAKALRERLCASGVTKYGRGAGHMIDLPKGRRTVLAVGQVDDDLSVRLGGAGVAGNLDFLTRVRAAEPDAWIVYRPHPDVQAGLRKGHVADAAVLSHADAIDMGSPLMDLVQAVDDVHVLSSLTGFEALMRGCSVTVHGMPFYAGWGLTRDLAPPCPRRGRILDIDALVAGALILYPRYVDPVTGLACGPELMAERIAHGPAPTANWLIRLRTLQGRVRRFMTLSAERAHG